MPRAPLLTATLWLALLCAASPLSGQDPRPVQPSLAGDDSRGKTRVLSRMQTSDGTATLWGMVTGEDGRPLTGASVSLAGTPWGGPADGEGRFRLVDLPAGDYRVEVRRIGYRPQRFGLHLGRGELVRVAVMLALSPVAIEGVVASSRASGRRAGFLARLNRSRGYFFTRSDIARLHPREIHDVLVRAPRVHLVQVEGREEIRMRGTRATTPRPPPEQRIVAMGDEHFISEPLASMRGASGETQTDLAEGDCPPLYFLDGMAFDPTLDHFPAEHIRPEWVEGIEIYAAGSVPIQFRQRGAECGVIVVWTQNGWRF